MIIVAIDIGKNGAIVEGDVVGRILGYSKMPYFRKAIWDKFASYKHNDVSFVIEDVGHSFPGNSAKSAHCFSLHRGHIEMALVGNGFEENVVWVRPQRWMKELGIPSGLGKKERKEKIYELVLQAYPFMDLSKYAADAVAIYMWYLKSLKQTLEEIGMFERRETNEVKIPLEKGGEIGNKKVK